MRHTKHPLKILLSVSLLAVMTIALASCISYTDPVTGQKMTVLDPNNGLVKFLDFASNAGEGAAPVLIALSAVWPPLALVVGIAGGLITMWKNLKPKVTQAQTEATQFYNVTGAIVAAIESWKKDNPESWTKLSGKLSDLLGPKAENVIRALRGLPPKPE